jgi:hypothetical protein
MKSSTDIVVLILRLVMCFRTQEREVKKESETKEVEEVKTGIFGEDGNIRFKV